MSGRVPEVSGASVVLVGSFNPTIFQPQWFVRQNLLSHPEGDAAEIKILAPQVCDFETERFRIQVTTDRFAALSKPDANPSPLRDLVLGTFFILEYTPLTALGLNRDMHFGMPSEEAWNQIGDKLAPKEGWKGILKGRPGMRTLSIQAEIPDFPDAPEGTKLTVKVEPSLKVKFGVYFQTNENYNAPRTDAMKFFMERIRSRWDGAYKYAAEIADHIIDWGSE